MEKKRYGDLNRLKEFNARNYNENIEKIKQIVYLEQLHFQLMNCLCLVVSLIMFKLMMSNIC